MLHYKPLTQNCKPDYQKTSELQNRTKRKRKTVRKRMTKKRKRVRKREFAITTSTLREKTRRKKVGDINCNRKKQKEKKLLIIIEQQGIRYRT